MGPVWPRRRVAALWVRRRPAENLLVVALHEIDLHALDPPPLIGVEDRVHPGCDMLPMNPEQEADAPARRVFHESGHIYGRRASRHIGFRVRETAGPRVERPADIDHEIGEARSSREIDEAAISLQGRRLARGRAPTTNPTPPFPALPMRSRPGTAPTGFGSGWTRSDPLPGRPSCSSRHAIGSAGVSSPSMKPGVRAPTASISGLPGTGHTYSPPWRN